MWNRGAGTVSVLAVYPLAREGVKPFPHFDAVQLLPSSARNVDR